MSAGWRFPMSEYAFRCVDSLNSTASLVLAAFFLSRWFLAWHGLCAFAGWRLPMSEYAFRCVDSLNSTASLVLAAVFCVWKGRQPAGRGVF